MRPHLLAVLAIGVSLAVATDPCLATPLDCAYNLATGFDDNTNTKLPNYSQDTKWVIGPGSHPDFIGYIPRATDDTLNPDLWLDDNASPDSRWLSLWEEDENSNSVWWGTYFYDTTFDLTGFHHETAALDNVRYASDNRLERVYLNGVVIWDNPSDGTEEFLSFIDLPDMLGNGFFLPGINELRFEVLNSGTNCTPTGLRIEGCVVAAPEPASWVMAVIGVGGLLGMARRRKRS